MRSEKRVAVAFFGDGATNTGTFHESMNLGQLWKVPAVFVLENNGWAESTPASQHLPLPVDELGKRAAAYGMKLIEADGQDVEAVYLATLAAREHALSGKGPVLLHLRTHRLTGHFVGDPQVYRDKEALKEERETKDPVRLLGVAARDRGRGVRDDRRRGDGRGGGGGRVREGGHRSGARGRAQVRLCLS